MKLSKDSRGIAHLAIFIVFAVAVLGFVGYTSWNAWQANKTKKDSTVPRSETEDKSTPSITADDRVIFPGSLNNVARDAGERIKKFYVTALKEGDRKSFLTEKAKAQLKEERSYSIVACGQVGILVISIDEPEISGNTASTNIKLLQFGQRIQEAGSGSLDLVKQDGKWLIDKFNCSL